MQESFQFSQVNFGFFRFKRRKKIFASCNCSSVSLSLPNFSYILLSIAKYPPEVSCQQQMAICSLVA